MFFTFEFGKNHNKENLNNITYLFKGRDIKDIISKCISRVDESIICHRINNLVQ